MTNFGSLLNEWRVAVAAESKSSGKAPLLLSATVFYSSDYYSLIYPIQAISNSLGWLNVTAYDLYTAAANNSPNKTGPPAALYNRTSKVSGDADIRAWIQAGVAANKLVQSNKQSYGHGWRLVNANNHGIFAPANGAASDWLGYGGIKDFITQNSATAAFNSMIVTDYCYVG
jgi:chitinase